MAVYAAQIDCLDQSVGRILALLDKHGQRDNTLVIVVNEQGNSRPLFLPGHPALRSYRRVILGIEP